MMKIALISVFACLVAVNASFLPQSRVGVTTNDIDTLIGDYLKALRTAAEGVAALPDLGIPIKTDNVDVTLTLKKGKIHVGDAKDYSESSSVTSNQVSASVSLTLVNSGISGGLNVKGTINGQSVDQTGDIALSWESGTHVSSFKASYDDKTVAVEEIKSDNTRTPTVAKISGIQIPGISEEQGEKAVGAAVDQAIKEAEDKGQQFIPTYIDIINQHIAGHTLQELYDGLRKQIPRSSH